MAKATGEAIVRLASLMKMVGLLALLTLSMSGCKQGQGDRCQLRTDCASGLVCVLPANGTCVGGGVCEPPVMTITRCVTSADCTAGYTCQASTDCTEAGALVCTPNADMTVPDDLVTSPTD